MSPELVTMAALAAPAAVLGPICLAGHLITRRHDDMVAAALRASRPEPPPTGPGHPAPLPEPEALADVIPLHTTTPRTGPAGERKTA